MRREGTFLPALFLLAHLLWRESLSIVSATNLQQDLPTQGVSKLLPPGSEQFIGIRKA